MSLTTLLPSSDGGLQANPNAGRKSREAAQAHVERLMKPIIERARRGHVHFASQLLEGLKRPDFSYEKLFEGIRGQRLSETITSSTVMHSINLSTVNDIMSEYGAYDAIYESIAEIRQSNSIEEIYPEEWSDDLPIQVAELQEAPQAQITGNEYRIRNFLYARMLSISKEAYDNDSRGYIRDRATNFGKNYKRVIDKVFISKLFKQLIPSNTNLPKTNALGQTSLVTSTPGPITPQRIKDALTLSAFIADPFGEFITVNFDTLVVDKTDEINALQFLTSMYSPTQFGPSSAGYNADTSPGMFTENVLRGRLSVAASPYVKDTRGPLGSTGLPALIMERKRGQVVQIRTDLTVEMENPLAGDSFKQRSYNWQGLIRFGSGNRNPRLFIIIN